jgi:hypothetical protein
MYRLEGLVIGVTPLAGFNRRRCCCLTRNLSGVMDFHDDLARIALDAEMLGAPCDAPAAG